MQDVDAAGRIPGVSAADVVRAERCHALADEPLVSEEQVVDEAECRHAVSSVQGVDLHDDVRGIAGADGDVRVGADRRSAERAVIRAAAGADHVGFGPSVWCLVGVIGQEMPVHERQPVDVRC